MSHNFDNEHHDAKRGRHKVKHKSINNPNEMVAPSSHRRQAVSHKRHQRNSSSSSESNDSRSPVNRLQQSKMVRTRAHLDARETKSQPVHRQLSIDTSIKELKIRTATLVQHHHHRLTRAGNTRRKTDILVGTVKSRNKTVRTDGPINKLIRNDVTARHHRPIGQDIRSQLEVVHHRDMIKTDTITNGNKTIHHHRKVTGKQVMIGNRLTQTQTSHIRTENLASTRGNIRQADVGQVRGQGLDIGILQYNTIQCST